MSRQLDALYLGLISGTSMDGVDAVLVELGARRIRTLAALTHPYSPGLARRLHAAIAPEARLSLDEFATLDGEVGLAFAAAAVACIEQGGVAHGAVHAIGSHGQTLRHAPHGRVPYTLQIGNPAIIAATVGVPTVAHFRGLDVAYGGEGAPLVPPFHAWALGNDDANRVVVNIGGIANLSILPAGALTPSAGFDTGPGNCLMDAWSCHVRRLPYDADGAWAASAAADPALLSRLLDDPYFKARPPKSTGREVFNLAWLEPHLAETQAAALDPAVVQATLCELTVETLAGELERLPDGWARGIYVCGGGAHNAHLMARLRARLEAVPVVPTSVLGLDPDMVEASAFAWLAAERMAGRAVPLTTGASRAGLLLGAVYLPTPA